MFHRSRYLTDVAACCALLVTVLPGEAARAQTASALTGRAWLRQQAAEFLRPGADVAAVMRGAERLFLVGSPDARGISVRSIETASRMMRANARAMLVAKVLAYDLDGDGIVTRAEVELGVAVELRRRNYSRETPEELAPTIARIVDDILAADRTRKGRVTYAELATWAEGQLAAVPQPEPPALALLGLDANGDGVVTREEFNAALKSVFDEADADRDGALSSDEVRTFAARLGDARLMDDAEREAREAEAAQRKARAACPAPEPSAQAKIVLYGAYTGRGLSSAAIGGDDAEVGVADIVIERGPDPIYLVLTSFDGMIWRVSGAVERVEHALIGAVVRGAENAPRAGVVGLPRDRVTILPKADCLSDEARNATSRVESDREKVAEAVRDVKTLTGRAPATVTGHYYAGRVGLPSGANDESAALTGAENPARSAAAKQNWTQFLFHRRAGLIRVDPASVTARLPVAPYGVLPREAGLAQLLDRDKLKPLGENHVVTINAPKPEISYIPAAYGVLAPTRLPHPIDIAPYVLASGGPRPEGDLKNARLYCRSLDHPLKPGEECR